MSEIKIIMESVDKPPKITLNDKDITGIASLKYKYVTKDSKSNGYHNFKIEYFCKETTIVRTVSVNLPFEGE